MSGSKVFAAVLLAASALIAQLTVVNRLQLPGGQPNLLVLVVLCVALIDGPGLGMGLGFGAGLLADLVGDHLIGRLALLFTLMGFGVGLLGDEEARPVWFSVLMVAVASFALSLVNSGLGVVVGEAGGGGGYVVRSALSFAGYDAVLTPFVFPAVKGLLRRADWTR